MDKIIQVLYHLIKEWTDEEIIDMKEDATAEEVQQEQISSNQQHKNTHNKGI